MTSSPHTAKYLPTMAVNSSGAPDTRISLEVADREGQCVCAHVLQHSGHQLPLPGLVMRT